MGRPGAPPVLDEEALHRYLFKESDRFQQLKLHQNQLAQLLMIDKDTVTDTLRRMEKAKRIKLVSRGLHKRATYYITNPDGEDAVIPIKRRKILWQ